MSARLFHILFSLAFLIFSRTVPAQTLPSLPVDGKIQKGTLRCGVAYYMVKNDEVKGFADIAVVRRGEAPSRTAVEGLETKYLSRNGIGPRPGGYFLDNDGSTVLHLDRVPVYDANVLDSTLLVTFSQVAASRAPEAVIVSGDIDPTEVKKKMDIFSMMVPQHFVENSHGPDYVWEPSVMPSIVFKKRPMGDRGVVRVAYASPRTPQEQMNTAQALVMGILSREFRTITVRRIERNLRDAGIPYGRLDFHYLNSTETGGDEEYAVEVQTDRDHLEAAMKIVSGTLAGLDGFGIPEEEFIDAKQVMMAEMLPRGSTPLTNRQYVDRCVSHFLYGANLAPYSEETRLFARKSLPDSTETRLFNQFATSLLSQLSNLTLEYRANLDSLDEDNALFQYNLAYLYGSTFKEAKDYSWQRDTSGLEVECPRIRIKETKPEPVSGGVLWTFSNGMRVVYKQVPGRQTFHYSLLLGGGLSGVSGLTEGEGGYFGDMLSLYDAGGLSASDFRDHLAVNGIRMDTQVALTYTSIYGEAPTSRLPTLLKALLALANGRTVNRGEFDICLRNSKWAQEPVDNRLYAMLYPGFSYSPKKYVSGLDSGTQAKAAQLYESLFSRMNDGMLIIVGDVDEATARRVLLRYLGGFRTQRSAAPRKSVRYQPRAGTITQRETGGKKGVYVRLDTEYPLSGVNYATAEVAIEVLRRNLVQALEGTGMSAEITTGFHTYPQERLWMFLSCEGGTNLDAVRAGIKKAATSTVAAKDLNAFKAMALAGMNQELTEPETVVTALVARYGIGKDLVTHYKESVNEVSAARVKEMLSALAAGSTAEIVIE
jgi:hypothetical protein